MWTARTDRCRCFPRIAKLLDGTSVRPDVGVLRGAGIPGDRGMAYRAARTIGIDGGSGKIGIVQEIQGSVLCGPKEDLASGARHNDHTAAVQVGVTVAICLRVWRQVGGFHGTEIGWA